MKVLYLIRGLPGSGKTTLANRLAEHCYAADDWFTDTEGGYDFDPSELGKAHEACQGAVLAAMKTGEGPIAVHNTFSKAWEASPYFRMAAEHQYDVFVLECQNEFGNVHNVPTDGIARMRERWESSVHPGNSEAASTANQPTTDT